MLGYKLLRKEIGVSILMFWLKKVLFAKAAASFFVPMKAPLLRI